MGSIFFMGCFCSAGLLLSVGGFLSFMLTGSVSAVRFGIILGGALLALSISSLKSYEKGQPCTSVVKGQAGQTMVCFHCKT